MSEPAPPSGRYAYLPPRAVRARKLILRTQLGLPWLLAAVAVALLILVAGVVLLRAGGRPGAPWVRVGRLPAAGGQVSELPGPAGRDVVVDRRGGRLRAFLVAPGACPVVAGAAGGLARPCAGQAWRADGVGERGAPDLLPVRALVSGGDLYVDPHPLRRPSP